jgi:nucleotide-binding universal stress UspA family protein
MGMTPAQKILVATDFSPASDDAIAQAIALAKQMNASLEILHVVEIGTEPFPFGLLDIKDGGDFFAYVERELDRRADDARRAGVPCTTKSIDGKPAEEIVVRARNIGADLIVVGTHGRSGIAHAFFGSVAEQVVRHADRPVVTVPFSEQAA